MYVRRDYSQPFFRQRKRRPLLRWLVMLALIIGLALFGYSVAMQPAAFAAAAYQTVRQFTAQSTPTPFASVLANQATEYYLNGDLEQAALLWEQAVAQRPEEIDYLYEYGQLLIDLSRPEPALDLAERIRQINANDVRGLALRARALVWAGNYSGAIPVGLAGIQLDAAFAPLYEALARAYTGSSEWAEGLQMGAQAVDLAPGDVRARWAYANALMAVGAREEAMVELERAIELHPAFTPPMFELAFLYLSFDRDRDAIDLYDRILGMQPRNARALLRQCDAYRKIGEFERALGLCQDAVNVDPTFSAAQYRLGIMRYNRREFAAAQAAFQACVERDAESLECQYRLGLAQYYVAQTTYQMCQANGAAACDVQPQCQQAWGTLENALLMTQAQTADAETIAIIQEGMTALTLDPACAGLRLRLPDPAPLPTAEATPGAEA